MTYYGKPHGPAAAACLRLLGPEVDPSRVLMVGDSIEHDVAGANAAGIHSLFVAGGIHAAEVGLDSDGAGGLSADALGRPRLQPTAPARRTRRALSLGDDAVADGCVSLARGILSTSTMPACSQQPPRARGGDHGLGVRLSIRTGDGGWHG